MEFDMLKTRISQGEKLVGTFVFLPSPALVEIIAKAGFDFIIVDMEHAPKDWSTVEHMIRAANIHDLPVLMRVCENSEKDSPVPRDRSGRDRAPLRAVRRAGQLCGRRGLLSAEGQARDLHSHADDGIWR
jgi:hypothetical protein